MADISKLLASPRNLGGKRNCRRLRQAGQIPGVLYGHSEAPESVIFKNDDLRAALATGHKILDLDVHGKPQKVLLKEVQWDTYGKYIQHVDFMRIDPNQRLTVEVSIELRGSAPGLVAGGIFDIHLRKVQIEGLAVEIPDFLIARVGTLEIGHSLHVRDMVDVPPGVKILTSPDALILQVIKPKEEVIVTEAAVGAAEGPQQPEVIGKKKEEGAAEPGAAEKEPKKDKK